MTTSEKEVAVKQVIVRDDTIPAEIGRDVTYVLSPADSQVRAGEHRPAKIVRLIDDGGKGLVNLQVFTDGGFDQLPNLHHAKNVVHDEEVYGEAEEEKKYKPGTWHWPPPRTLVFQARERPLTEEEIAALTVPEEHPAMVPPPPETSEELLFVEERRV